MADGFTFKVDVKDVLKNITAAKSEINSILENELENFGKLTVNDAKRLAPTDEGTLKGAIGYVQTGLNVTITVNVDYAAYIEFGTKSFAASYVSGLPAEWQTFAAQYKGKAGKGSMEEFVLRLTEWVRRKGIASQFSTTTKKRVGSISNNKGNLKQRQNLDDYHAAYGIALHIIRKGIKPHPFLYPAYSKNIDLFIKNIKSALSK